MDRSYDILLQAVYGVFRFRYRRYWLGRVSVVSGTVKLRSDSKKCFIHLNHLNHFKDLIIIESSQKYENI